MKYHKCWVYIIIVYKVLASSYIFGIQVCTMEDYCMCCSHRLNNSGRYYFLTVHFIMSKMSYILAKQFELETVAPTSQQGI